MSLPDVIASMPNSLHIANGFASGKVCTARNDTPRPCFYTANMARTRPRIPVGWFLREWMETLKVRQADMMKRAGWSKTTASLLYNCQQDYNPQLVRDAARALNVEEWELLMPPSLAMQIRRLRAAVDSEVQLRVAEERATLPPPEPAPDRLRPRKAS